MTEVRSNPLAVSRYRDRRSPSRSKCDAGDAYVLANILRTDPLPSRGLVLGRVCRASAVHSGSTWHGIGLHTQTMPTFHEPVLSVPERWEMCTCEAFPTVWPSQGLPSIQLRQDKACPEHQHLTIPPHPSKSTKPRSVAPSIVDLPSDS